VARRQAMASLLLLVLMLPAVAATGCEECCAAGGSCAAAYKQTPGICCGTLGNAAFCCPVSAKCFKCENGSYRCYGGGSSPSCAICGEAGDPRANCKPPTVEGGSGIGILVVIILAVCLCSQLKKCGQQEEVHGHYVAAVEPPTAFQPPMGTAYGEMPMGQPVYGQQAGYTQPGYVQQTMYAQPAYAQPVYQPTQQEGYSGTTVAASAAAGFIGGMLADRAFSHNSDRGFSGSFEGGGDSDDAGFAADN